MVARGSEESRTVSRQQLCVFAARMVSFARRPRGFHMKRVGSPSGGLAYGGVRASSALPAIAPFSGLCGARGATSGAARGPPSS